MVRKRSRRSLWVYSTFLKNISTMVRKRSRRSRQSRRSNAANNSVFLPTDLIIEILSRLSVKDMVRFKCVSKSWKTLISDSNFVDKHFKMNIFIENGRGMFTLLVNSLDLIVDVKKKIFKETRIPEHQQMLMFDGKHLNNNMPLASYNIQPNSTLNRFQRRRHLNLRRRMFGS